MKIIAIAAVDEEWGIGKDGQLPWDHMEDRQYFKRVTMGAPCIMGRNTYADMSAYFKKDMLMPGRHPIVVSESLIRLSTPVRYKNIELAATVQQAISIATEMSPYINADAMYFIGGSSIYRHVLENALADQVYLSHIPGNYGCDTFFPREGMRGYDHYTAMKSPNTGITYSIYTKKENNNE